MNEWKHTPYLPCPNVQSNSILHIGTGLAKEDKDGTCDTKKSDKCIMLVHIRCTLVQITVTRFPKPIPPQKVIPHLADTQSYTFS